jgi:site-specific DNA-methyltransferase (adenine-specific)
MTPTIATGDSLHWLQTLPDASFDALVTDPPAGIGFMGKAWDGDKGGRDQWIAWLAAILREAHRVLKPGAHGLVWALPRTSHWTGMACEDAGFDVRDIVTHLFGSGFPKSTRIDRDQAFCQCDAPAHNAACRDREPLQPDHIDKDPAACDGALQPASARHLSDKAQDSRADCPQHHDLHGEQPRQPPKDAQEHPPSQEDAPKRNHSCGREDGSGCEQGRSPYPARCTDRPASTGFATQTAPTSSPDILENRRPLRKTDSDTAQQERRNTNKDGFALPYRLDTTSFSTCQVCGKPVAKGWGTALKPAVEFYFLIRKPVKGTVAANVLRYGTGALNVDGCRIGDEVRHNPSCMNDGGTVAAFLTAGGETDGREAVGRWPAHLVLSGDAPAMLDAQAGQSPGESDGVSRFYYCSKAATDEREAGLDDLPLRTAAELVGRTEGSAGMNSPRAGAGASSNGRRNIHPTVKPIDLMRWLCRLVTPPGGLVIDPFTGSGTTGVACVLEGFNFTGCELDPAHVAIAQRRIAAAQAHRFVVTDGSTKVSTTPAAQLDLFD